MKYTTAFNVWEVPVELLKHAQAGQWIYAGERSNKGIFLGVKRSGVVVVAWYGNIKNQHDKIGYVRTLRKYAKGVQ
jgi:hypothetical protein